MFCLTENKGNESKVKMGAIGKEEESISGVKISLSNTLLIYLIRGNVPASCNWSHIFLLHLLMLPSLSSFSHRADSSVKTGNKMMEQVF